MSEWVHLEGVVEDLREGRLDRLSIGYFASAGSAWMPTLVKRLREEFPDLVLELVLNEVDRPATRPDLDVVMGEPDAQVPPGCQRTELVRDPFVIVVPRAHRLADLERAALSDLRREIWVSNDFTKSHGHQLVIAACKTAGFQPRFSVQAQDHHTAIGFVAAGVGISVMPGLAARFLPANVTRLDIVGPRPVRHLAAVRRDLGAPHPAADRALEILTDLIAHPSRAVAPAQ
jgi:DNA-binding transcriptional LysR family regulator